MHKNHTDMASRYPMRRAAEDYCKELGLEHHCKGEEPHKYLIVSRNTDVPDDTWSAAEKKEHFDATLKKSVHAHNDAEAAKQVDKVDLGREGWRDRYYKEKMPGVDPDDVARHYIDGLVWVFKYVCLKVCIRLPAGLCVQLRIVTSKGAPFCLL